jgi:hypothetical protein
VDDNTLNKNSNLNESISINQRISNIHRFLKYLAIIVSTGGVAFLVFLNLFYKGKVYDIAFDTFLFFWLLVVPSYIGNAIVEKIQKNLNFQVSLNSDFTKFLTILNV